MSTQNQMAEQSSDREFVMTRVFAAPRKLAWQAWSDCAHLSHWWGPKDWTLPVCKMDFRPGGIWHYCMRSPAGEESWGRAIYHEIIEPERIVYTDAFADATGNPSADMPEMLITVTFEELEGKTTITTRTQFASAADLEAILAMGMVEGMTETWNRLEAYLLQV